MQIRADTKLNSYNEETRTVDFVFATTVPVKTVTGQGVFMEVLSMKPEHIRLERFLNGAPVLRMHNRDDTDSHVGVITAAMVDGDKLIGTIKLSGRDDLAGLRMDVKEGILRSGSVGYKVHKHVDITGADGVRTLLAVDWEPCEFSLVSVPADHKAQARNDVQLDSTVDLSSVSNISNSRAAVQTEEGIMPDLNQDAANSDTAKSTERTRAAEILSIGQRAGMPNEWAVAAITTGATVDAARTEAMEAVLTRSAATKVQGQHITVAENGNVIKAAGEALFAQLNNTDPASDQARSMMACSPLEIAGLLADAKGIKATKHGKDGMIERALHTTSDFPVLFQQVAGRTLAARLQARPLWYDNTLVSSGVLSDFKASDQISTSGFPSLLKMNEAAEFEGGTFTSAKQSVKLKTYGRKIGVTGELLRNDDLGIFDTVIGGLDVALNRLKSVTVSDAYLSNPVIGETGFALFGTGANSHSNLLTGGTSAASLNALTLAEKILMKTKTLDGDTMGLRGATIVVGSELYAVMTALLAPVNATSNAAVNIYSGRFKVLLDPRIDDMPVTATFNPVTSWFMFSPSGAAEVLKTFNLAGQNSPVVETQDSWNTWGMEVRAHYAFAAAAMSYRGAVMASGF